MRGVMKNKIIIIICFAYLLFSGLGNQPKSVTAAGKIYYVATTGNDSNSGTIAQPWLTPQHASDNTVAGDIVYFRAGTYTNATRWTFANSGDNVNGYIIYQNYPGETVNIQLTNAAYSGMATNGKNYLKFSGINFLGDSDTGSYGLFVYQSNHIIIQNCTVTGTAGSGIYTREADYVTIDGCVLNRCRMVFGLEENLSLCATSHFEVKNCVVRDPGTAQALGIDMKEGCHDGSVHDNEVYNLSGMYNAGIYIDARGNSYNIDIYNNKIHDIPDSGSYGISMGDENPLDGKPAGSVYNVNVYNNVVWNCKSGGIILSQTGTRTSPPGAYGYTTFKNVYIINNTFYNNGCYTYGSEFYSDIPASNATNIVYRNNISYKTITLTIPICDVGLMYDSGKLLADHNLWYTSNGTFYTDKGYVKGTNTVETDPMFINAPTNLNIESSSSAKDTGSVTLAPSTDYLGTTRPQGSRIDISTEMSILRKLCQIGFSIWLIF
jgi:hypothetical protein